MKSSVRVETMGWPCNPHLGTTVHHPPHLHGRYIPKACLISGKGISASVHIVVQEGWGECMGFQMTHPRPQVSTYSLLSAATEGPRQWEPSRNGDLLC
jgi:hypothetical protein